MFSHGSTWKHTHTVKQLVTSTPTASPCSTGLLRFDLFSAPAFWRGFNKTWHGLMPLGVFTALKTVWYEHENDCRNRNGGILDLNWEQQSLHHPIRFHKTKHNGAADPHRKQIPGRFQWVTEFVLKLDPGRWLSKSSQLFFFPPFIYGGRFAWAPTAARPGPLSHISSCVGATPAAEAPLGRRHHDADGELIRPHAARIRDVTCRHSCVFMKMKNHVVVAGWVELWWINPSSVGAVCGGFMSFFWLHLLPCYSSPVHLSASSPTLCRFLLFPALPCFVIPGGLPLWDPLHFLPPR